MHRMKWGVRLFLLFVLLLSTSYPAGGHGLASSVARSGLAAPSTYETASTWQLPLDGKWTPVTQQFDVWNGTWNGNHLGQDITRTTESPVKAAANGRVKYSGSAAGYGHVVIIEHRMPDNSYFISLYGHLKSSGLVPVETDVSKGVVIGYLSGDKAENGGYTFIHLHFGIREGQYSSQSYTCGGKTTWLYRGYSCNIDPFSPSHWRYGDQFILQHSNNVPACPAPGNGQPRDQIVLNNNRVNFSWTPPSCDGLDNYTFRVSNHPDIDNPPWIIDHGVDKSASSTTEDIHSQYHGQTLYWAIWPHNSSGYGSRGGPWSFKIDTSNPGNPPALPKDSWNVEYFRNKELTDSCAPASSFTSTFIFRDWGDGSPASGCNSDHWGARFRTRVHFPGGDYAFALEADDWGRIYVDGNLFVDKWNGATQHYEGHYVSAGEHEVQVEFADTLGGAKISAWWWGPGFEIPHDNRDPNQWYAEYWINPNQWWDAFARKNEGTGRLYHLWGDNSPGWDMPVNNFSARFKRNVFFECGRYRFVLDHDDGARFLMDQALKVDRWNGAIGPYPFELDVSRGNHELQVDVYENEGAAHLELDWTLLNGCNPTAPSLISPHNLDHLAANTDVTLSWNTAPGATQYYAQLTGGPGVNIHSDWISGTQWHIGVLLPGVYTWSVTARNEYGSSLPAPSWSFTVLEPPPTPPDANFEGTPVSGQAPLNVTFKNLSTGSFSTCEWNYGDWQTGTSCDDFHNHTYTSPGVYTVKLTVSGAGGSNTKQKTSYIQVSQAQTCYSLSTNANPSGSGSITLFPEPNCGGSQYTSSSVVQVTALGKTGYRFTGWSGHLSGDDNPAYITLTGNRAITANFVPETVQYWKGEYFTNPNLSGSPTLVRDDFSLHMDWKWQSPDPAIPVDYFSARWTRTVYFPAGKYAFHMRHDDGGRLYIDGSLVIDAWDTCCTWDDHTIYLSEGNHQIKVEVSELEGAAHVELWWERLDISGWKGEYFNNDALFERPTIIRNDPEINFEWLDNAPDPFISNERFSVRWTKTVYFAGGLTRFFVWHDDGARLYIDDQIILDNWCDNCRLTDYIEIPISAGQHQVKLEMYENSGWSGAHLWWERPSSCKPNCIFLPSIIQ